MKRLIVDYVVVVVVVDVDGEDDDDDNDGVEWCILLFSHVKATSLISSVFSG